MKLGLTFNAAGSGRPLPRSIEVRPMKTMQYATTTALALALATPSHVQIRTGAEQSTRVSQYCVPPDNITDVHKLYCRDGRGREAPTGT